MSALDSFIASTSLKITSITALLRIPGQPDSTVHSENICPEKRTGDVTITIMASRFMEIEDDTDFPIIFDRLEQLESSDTRVLARLHSQQTFNQPLKVHGAPRVQLRTVSGHITVELRAVRARDENDCSDHLKRYVVALASTTSSEPNQLVVGVEFLGQQTINVDAITFEAIAGGERPPGLLPPLLLTDVVLAVDRYCTSTSARVTGFVQFNRIVEERGRIVRVDVSATAFSPDGWSPLVPVFPHPVPIRMGSSRGSFQVQTPADFYGTVTVTAVFDTQAPLTYEIEVLDIGNPFCLNPDDYYLDQSFRLLEFPCPGLDLTSLGHMISWQDGVLCRKRADEPAIYFRESVGGDVRKAAINEFAEVAGSSIDATGKLHGFILLAAESSPAIIINDVQLTAINDDGLAIGYKRSKGLITAFAFALTRPKDLKGGATGKAINLTLPKATRSEAVAVNNLGQIVVLAFDGATRILLFEKGKGTEIGKISQFGTVLKLTDSGFLIGNEFTTSEMVQPFLISLNGKKGDRIGVPALKGFKHTVANDIDERGTVVGRAFTSNGKKTLSSGFRYTDSRGTENLNDLVALDDGALITAAICITRRRDIVVEIARGDTISYQILRFKG